MLRSLFASPVDAIFIIDHTEDRSCNLELELNQFKSRVFTGEPQIKERLKKGLRVEYYRHENNGYGGGHNVGIRKGLALGSKYHLVVNPDIWFGPRVIPALVDYMNSHDNVAQMMPKILYPNGAIQPLAKMLPTPMDIIGRLCFPRFIINKRNRRFELTYSNYQMVLNVPYLSGCFMFFRTSALKEVNMFNEEFFMYAEDIDITRRLHKKYQTLYYPKVPVYHKFNRASHHSLRLFWIHVTNIIMYFNRWGWFNDKERTEINNRLLQQIADGGITD